MSKMMARITEGPWWVEDGWKDIVPQYRVRAEEAAVPCKQLACMQW
jgi:hypothetical protein